MGKRPNPELIDDENPELTAEWFARARPAAEVLREQFGAGAEHLLKPKRGRPPKTERKRAINIRLSPDVLEHFRAGGPGWQTRLEEVLKKHIAKAPPRPAQARRRAKATGRYVPANKVLGKLRRRLASARRPLRSARPAK